ncbi:MAG: hypothetical protein WD398_13400 [Cyclobacteriaceae bacterium]
MKLLFPTTLLFFMIGLISCNTEKSHGENSQNVHRNQHSERGEGSDSDQFSNMATNQNPEKEAPMNQSTGKRVAIIDQSLNMPMGTVHVPQGWILQQDIASNTQGSGYLNYLLALESPTGEVFIMLPSMVNYSVVQDAYSGQVFGASFEQTLFQLTEYQLKGRLDQFSLGEMRAVAGAEQEEAYQKVLHNQQRSVEQMNQMAVSYGMPASMQVDMGLFQIKIQGNKNGKAISGVLNVFKSGTVDHNPQQRSSNGHIFGNIVLSTNKSYEELAAIKEDIMKLQINPDWDRQKALIIDRQSQISSQNHQNKMASRERQFQQHQNNMRQTQEIYDQQNQAWFDQNFGPNGSASYSSNDAFIDGVITGNTTFNDPYTGHQIKKEGHYDYWYTNEFGEYKGTNDPGFDPNSLQGNWNAISPVKPDH